MRYLQTIIVCLLFIVVMAACQPAASTPLVPEDPQTPTDSPGPTLEGPPIQQTQPSNPLITPEDIDMPAPITPDAAAQTMVDLVKENLAQRLGISVEQISLVEVRQTVWRDASLGCPKPNIDYIRVETPGYKIVLEASGRTYNYHTDQEKRFIICNR